MNVVRSDVDAFSPTVPTIPGTIPSLDGIRALAVCLVFFAHGGLQWIIPGGLGVTVFFVLSGYLITTLMRREHAASGRLDLPAFYMRRLLRLMPPLLLVIAGTAVLSMLSLVEGAFTAQGLLSALFYFGNYYVIAADFQGLPAGVGVVWSLAVEEHFYLFFPLMAVVLLHVGRPGVSLTVLSGCCLAILAWRCWLAWHGASENYLGMATDTRADSILIGCAMAMWCNPVLDPVPGQSMRRDLAIAAGCILLLALSLLIRDVGFRLTFRYTLQSLAIAPLIYLAVARAASVPFRWLEARFLVYLGSVSYTVYLAHHIVLEALAWHWPRLGGVGTLVIAATLTLLIAEAMRRWVEQPCAVLRRRLHQRRPVDPDQRPAHDRDGNALRPFQQDHATTLERP
ncbi:acyltransferase family protein [Pseudomarimonas salicorniae]|uniref:Acyltransferase n=1 Tax=Pseudomarimonas salicorniae TaxID=2933270 RepID=A0ABT0GF79_9GAMM|nr:acyltransferase [Lysobacter sp. CAU 1642]MCK7593083.1 acyltransferase [Lysobacter sp. CAU 1642]